MTDFFFLKDFVCVCEEVDQNRHAGYVGNSLETDFNPL